MQNLEYENSPHATHQPALIWTVKNTGGPVLELGTGYYSTRLLHDLLKHEKRNLVSVDDDAKWINKFQHMSCEWHSFNLIQNSIMDWDEAIKNFSKINWGVVFIDQTRPPISKHVRNKSLDILIHSSVYIVAHDADKYPEMKRNGYKYFEYTPEIKPRPDRNGLPSFIFSMNSKLPKTNKSILDIIYG